LAGSVFKELPSISNSASDGSFHDDNYSIDSSSIKRSENDRNSRSLK
jgi:hypothetical protein